MPLLSAYDAAVCFFTLLFGFLLLKTSVALAASDLIANGLANLSVVALTAIGFEITQNGAELRNAASGAALSVTQACDGLGIFVVFASVLLAVKELRRNAAQTASILLASFFALQLFNFLRVVILFAALPASSTFFEILHLYVFPLVSSVIVGLMLMMLNRSLRPDRWQRAAAWCGLAGLLAVLWHLISVPATAASVVHLAQAWLALFGSGLTIASEGRSALVQAAPPLALPFYPSDFTIVLPLVLASAAITGFLNRSAAMPLASLVVSLAASMSIAMALAAWGTQLSALGERHTVSGILAAALQDALVYANLLLSPWLFLLIDSGGKIPPAKPAANAKTSKRRIKAANGRR